MKTEGLIPFTIGFLFMSAVAHSGTYIYAKNRQSAEQQSLDKGGCRV